MCMGVTSGGGSSAVRTRQGCRARGASFLLDTIVGAPPPPPPPKVPPLPDAGKGAQVAASMRDRMEAHRKNPVCAGCHARMDPLGFAFENFDGIGKGRTHEANPPITASGTFPNGAKFDGPGEFVKFLVSQREEFIRTFADKLLTY